MNIRQYLGSKIPVLTVKTSVTDAEIQAVESYGPMHRFLLGTDAAWGAWGGKEPFTSISGRTAKNVFDAQLAAAAEGAGPWYDICPFWALALGAALETNWVLPFISYPGHLQGAKDADLARQVSGIRYLTGIRVLKPE